MNNCEEMFRRWLLFISFLSLPSYTHDPGQITCFCKFYVVKNVEMTIFRANNYEILDLRYQFFDYDIYEYHFLDSRS